MSETANESRTPIRPSMPASPSRIVLIGVAVAATCLNARATNLEVPKIQVVDELGVSMSSGQVSYQLTPVRIGGDGGLGYTITAYANEVAWDNDEGFKTIYTGQAKSVTLSTKTGYTPANVMRVSDGTSSADFEVIVAGTIVNSFSTTPQPYTYAPVGDQRHSLVVSGSTLVWTKPDGTTVTFERGTHTYAGDGGGMTQIVYPTGYTVSFGFDGIRDNRGFQLMPVYVPDTRVMDKTDNPNLASYIPKVYTSAASGWSASSPKYVIGLNNAYEYCAAPPATCAPAQAWPTATFDWPPGMPRSLFIGDTTVNVTDASGALTAIRYRAYDLAYDKSGNVILPYVPGTEYSPRIVGIKAAGATAETYNYDYNNVFIQLLPASWNQAPWEVRGSSSGVVKAASHIGKQGTYGMLNSQYGDDILNSSQGDGGISTVYKSVNVAGNPDLMVYVDTRDGRISYEGVPRNFVTGYAKLTPPSEGYQYDARGNLSTITRTGVSGDIAYQTAHYPASCTPATSKTCNQADWVADANGNKTLYTYHAPSGLVATVTSPANPSGVVAQTRYEYTQLSAHYYSGGSSKIAGSPIWKKTAERYCINSNYTTACAANDEVVTRFEYNNDNLLMTGMTVTSPDGATLRTCYAYDRFGNQIGKTSPNAALASCN